MKKRIININFVSSSLKDISAARIKILKNCKNI